jgi:hypothetical protein
MFMRFIIAAAPGPKCTGVIDREALNLAKSDRERLSILITAATKATASGKLSKKRKRERDETASSSSTKNTKNRDFTDKALVLDAECMEVPSLLPSFLLSSFPSLFLLFLLLPFPQPKFSLWYPRS